MKHLIEAVVIAVAVTAPVASFAQQNAPVTRAQVRAEIVQLANAGYHVGDGDNASYPDAIQAAEARVAASNGNTGYGGVPSGSSQAGGSSSSISIVSPEAWNSMYGH